MSKIMRELVIGTWNIGFAEADIPSMIRRGVTEIGLDVTWLKHSYKDRFFADPFFVDVDGERIRILVEEFPYVQKKGVISLLTVDQKEKVLMEKLVILNERDHLSYPFYFPETNVILPECRFSLESSLYRWGQEAPIEKRAIVNRGLVDATPFRYHGKWWIFAMTEERRWSDLFIFFAYDLQGPYTPHPNNPVKSDRSCSRPAGKIFEVDGRYYRPVQDCSERYGQGVRLMEITDLSESSFREREYGRVLIKNPGKYRLGFHTLNQEGNLVVVDGYAEEVRPFSRMLYRKLPRIYEALRKLSVRMPGRKLG